MSDDLPVDYNSLEPLQRKAVRERYARIQNGLCHHCGEPLSAEPAKHVYDKPIKRWLFPKTFFQWPVHLHHDHNTGMTIGAVHNYCNAVLWQYHGE